ncbi:MAG: hypothetical protein Fur0018_04520 [Anaerolineales bacterium]
MPTSDVSLPNVCPHLGVAADADTRFAYPSVGNWCYRVHSPEGIALEYQQRYCLSDGYEACPVFAHAGERLPEQARQQKKTTAIARRSIPWGWLLTVIVALAVLGAAGMQWGRSAAPAVEPSPFVAVVLPADTPHPSPTPTEPLPVFTATPADTRSPNTPTPPVATATLPPPTIGPGLETPFGPQTRFLVHKVGVGESLTAIAEHYSTSVDVLRATNVFVPGATLWAGQTLVVMPGVTVVPDDVPPLLPVYVERDIALDVLAQQYAVDIGALRTYNALGGYDFIPGGRWLLVPQGG